MAAEPQVPCSGLAHTPTVTLHGGLVFILQTRRGACRGDKIWLKSSKSSIGAARGCAQAHTQSCPTPAVYTT